MYLRRLIAALTLIALVATGCTSSDQEPEPPDLVPDSKLLPDPLPLPVGDPDEAAASLAANVLEGGDAGTAALLTAIRSSGIGVVDAALDDKVTLEAAEPNLGLAFQAGEVLAMSRLIASDYRLSLGDVADLYSVFTPPEAHLDRAPVSSFIVDGIRSAAKDDTIATARFWGHFILELGRQHGDPLDSPTKVPDSTQLDGVQVLFLLLRAAGDLRTLAVNGGTLRAAAATEQDVVSPEPMMMFQQTAPAPCHLGHTAAEVLEVTGVSLAFGSEQYIHYVAHLLGEGSKLATYAGAISYINGALALIKFIATVAAFDGRIEMKGGEQLTRRRDKLPGEQRDLVLTLRMDTGRGSYLNCLRTLINLGGLDVSLPDDGPIAHAKVDWSLLEGGDLVRFCALQCGRTGNPVVGDTNEEGEASTRIEGRPRPRVVPESAGRLTKQAFVRASVNLKPAKMLRDIWDAIATVVVGAAAAPVVFTTELLYRVGAFGAGLRFAVIDYGERWHIDMRMLVRGSGSGSNLVATWNGNVDVDPATGKLTGQGTGSLNGHQSVCFSLNTLVYYRINVDVTGSYSVSFGGTKEGDQFELEVRGVDPDIIVNGNLNPNCEFEPIQEQLEAVAVDPGRVFGVDGFSFEGGETHILRREFHPGTAELEVTATPVPTQ